MLMRFYRHTFFTLLFLFTATQTLLAANNDSLYAKRLKKVDSLGMGYNKLAGEIIAEYIANPKATAEALARYEYYKPFLDSVMRAYNIPTQVGLLVMAASGADCFYKDEESGNCGPWALQFRVARMYGLKMNTYVDERMDFEQTTLLAGKYLKELHLIYGSWPMTMAAFTTNTLTINKFIRRSGNTFNYWEMYDSLPSEAQTIVPSFIGAMYIYYYANESNVKPKVPYKAISYDTVRMTKWMSFEVLAPALHTSVAALQTLNPIFKKGIIPYSVQNYILKLPKSSKPWFGDIDGLEFKPYNNNPYVEEVPELADKNLPKPKHADVHTGEKTVIHVVTRGQGLGIIAQKYGVKVDDIRKWNNIKGYTIYPNQKLKIIRKSN